MAMRDAAAGAPAPADASARAYDRIVVVPGRERGVVAVAAAPVIDTDAATPGCSVTALLDEQGSPIAAAIGLRLRYRVTAADLVRLDDGDVRAGCGRPVRAMLLVDGREVASALATGTDAVVDLAVTLGTDAATTVVTAVAGTSTLLAADRVVVRSELAVWSSDGDEHATVRSDRPLRVLLEAAPASAAHVVWARLGTSGVVPADAPAGVHAPRAREARVDPSAGRPPPILRQDDRGRLRGDGMLLAVSGRRPDAAALMAGGGSRPLKAGVLDHRIVDDLVLDPLERPQALPVVRDPAADRFPDRIDASRTWYCPRFVVVLPETNSDPDSGPFGFDVTRLGAVSGPDGLRQGLSAVVRVRLRPLPPSEPITGTATSVPLGNVAVSFEVPYRPAGQGGAQYQSFPAEVVARDDGDLDVTVALLDDWVRLAYGALSRPGFQTIPARFTVRYGFAGYSVLESDDVMIVAPLKLAVLPEPIVPEMLVPVEPSRGEHPEWVATAEIDRLDTNAVAVDGAALDTVRLGSFARQARDASLLFTTRLQNANRLDVTTPLIAVDPVRWPGKGIEYVRRTHLREAAVDALVRCADFGSWYRETADGATRALGCTDALTLGTTTLRLYEEVAAQRTARFTVWRSLTQPGRFLVVPASYRIARYDADQGDSAFRPAVHLSGAIDVNGNMARYLLHAVLQADVTAAERVRLLAALRPLVASGGQPLLDWPTDAGVGASFSFSWVASGSLPAPSVVAAWDGFRATVDCSLLDALLLNDMVSQPDGLSGSVRIGLPDGTAMTARLVLDTRPCGPWSTGPVTVDAAGSVATVTNRIERPVTVLDVLAVGTSGALVAIPVNQTVGPAAGVAVDVSTAGASPALVADAQADAGPLPITESNVYAQDVVVTIQALNQCDLAARAIASMVVRLRVANESGERALSLDAAHPTASVTVSLPITSYLLPQSLSWCLDVIGTDGATRTTAWVPHRLSTERGLITITPDRLPAGPAT